MLKNTHLLILFFAMFLSACAKINLYEKQVAIPGQKWYSDFKPSYTFEIEDTTALYSMYVVIRHTDAYEYNNMWLRLGSAAPQDTMQYRNINVQLATSTQWLGTGVSDIFEVRQIITPGPAAFKKAGTYTFTLEQIMRENPLEHILNVGLRIEKAN